MGRFWAQLRLPFKMLLLAIPIAGVLWLSYTLAPEWFTRVSGQASQQITGVSVPTATFNAAVEQPSSRPVHTAAQVRAEGVTRWHHESIAWNGAIGLLYAVGGAETTHGSLMQRAGVPVTLTRQDDYAVMQADLLAFANAFKNGNSDPTVGATSVTIMGDAAPGFLAALQPQLDRLNLHARIIGATGRSFGEDKCMGPVEWADNPQRAKGGVIAGVLRDGDIHICLLWAQANNIKVNPDEHTYDPDALNFYATASFTDADQAYITGRCESRPVVRNGQGTGDTNNRVCVQGTATWTPGDVNVLQNKGGVVSLLSTRETGAQMFATIIVIDEWARANPATVTNFLQAALDGSATVAGNRTALRQGAAVSAVVWGEQDADYWERYYNGRMEDSRDTGRQVRLGGSQALGLASNLSYFLPANNSTYTRVYNTFGELDRTLYPSVMPEFPTDVVNTMFLERIRDAVGNGGTSAVNNTFNGAEGQQVAARSYSINFEAGSARILPSSLSDLNQILNNTTVASGLAVAIDGFTSSEGDNGTNQRLSEARAAAVRDWLVQHAPSGTFPRNRIRVQGNGEQNLVLDSSGSENKAASRRVEIRLLAE